MSYYEEHLNVIASRMKQRLKTGETRKELEKYLKYCGWNETEIDLILKKAEK